MLYHELNYNSSTAVRSFLEQRGMRLSKRFGQNFLVDPHIRHRICQTALADLSDKESPFIWEIGPGIGSLTQELLAAGSRLTVFEIDHGLIAVLREFFAEDLARMEIVTGDCVETLPAYASNHALPDVLVGNLPYNAASAILMTMLEKGLIPGRIIVMLQRESALRLTASPGTKEYSAFSVACQARCQVNQEFDIPPESFFPRPEVVSRLVSLRPLVANQSSLAAASDLPPFFSALVRRAFQSRRKTLRNNFRSCQVYPGLSGELVLDAFSDLGIAAELRAETVSVSQFIEVSRYLASRQ